MAWVTKQTRQQQDAAKRATAYLAARIARDKAQARLATASLTIATRAQLALLCRDLGA
jgi:hypothetical protein